MQPESSAEPYHHYLVFEVEAAFYDQPLTDQHAEARQFTQLLAQANGAKHALYATRGFQAGTTFMLWVQAENPEYVSDFLGDVRQLAFGRRLRITHTFFGMVRPSQYSGRVGKSDQVMQNYDDRLPYFIVYPFTKTAEWHLLEFDERRRLMGGHIKVGVTYPEIRQCLLYAYGVSDHEFIVSYESNSLEHFQDLVMDLRSTQARLYTANDTPIIVGLYKTPSDFISWL